MDWLVFNLAILVAIDVLFLIWGLILSIRLHKLNQREIEDFVILAIMMGENENHTVAKKKGDK